MSESTGLPGDLNLAFTEELYASYLVDRQSVSEEWRSYFDSFEAGSNGSEAVSRTLGRPAPASMRPGCFAREPTVLRCRLRSAMSKPSDRKIALTRWSDRTVCAAT